MKKILVVCAALMLAVSVQAQTVQTKNNVKQLNATQQSTFDQTKIKTKQAGKAIVEAGKATGQAVAEGTRATGKAIKEKYPEVVDSVSTTISKVAENISIKANRLSQKLKENQ